MSGLHDWGLLDLEYRLTIASRTDCDCFRYFVIRRDALFPEVLRMATERGEDVADFFHAYARKVHARHESGLSLAVTA